jgi:hypothetical protein
MAAPEAPQSLAYVADDQVDGAWDLLSQALNVGVGVVRIELTFICGELTGFCQDQHPAADSTKIDQAHPSQRPAGFLDGISVR